MKPSSCVSLERKGRFLVVRLLSHVQLFATPWTAACQSPLSFTVFQSLLRFMSTELLMLTNHLILCNLLLLSPSKFPSIRVFPVSRLLTSGGQSIGASAFASILPMNIQGWFPRSVLQGKERVDIFLMLKETKCWGQGLWWVRPCPASWQQELRGELIDPCPKADRKDTEPSGRSAHGEACGYVSIQVWPHDQWQGLKGRSQGLDIRTQASGNPGE